MYATRNEMTQGLVTFRPLFQSKCDHSHCEIKAISTCIMHHHHVRTFSIIHQKALTLLKVGIGGGRSQNYNFIIRWD